MTNQEFVRRVLAYRTKNGCSLGVAHDAIKAEDNQYAILEYASWLGNPLPLPLPTRETPTLEQFLDGLAKAGWWGVMGGDPYHEKITEYYKELFK